LNLSFQSFILTFKISQGSAATRAAGNMGSCWKLTCCYFVCAANARSHQSGKFLVVTT